MTYHQKKNWKSYCSEPLELVENYKQAEADDFEGWCMHHRREIKLDGTRASIQELKDQNLYYGRPASELVFMKVGEHSTLHNKDKVISAETRQKMSEALKGRQFSAEHRKKLSEALSGENNPLFGRHHSEETRQKMSEALSGENNPLFGKHRSVDTRKKIAEAHKGKLWWNNGISSKRSRECPGEGWKRGMLKVSTTNCKT